MRKGVATILVFAVASVPTTAWATTTASPQIPSQPTQQQKRIIGGSPDSHNDTDWVASLIRRTDKTTELCGGSLIASRYVITAAHCVRNASRGQLTVRLGSKHWNRGGAVRGVDRIFVYPRFNPRTLYGDLAVVKLSRRVNLGPASLVSSGTRYVTNPPTEADVDGKRTGQYVEDVAELDAAVQAAKGETSKPSIIILKTIIGWPSPGKQNTGKIHGSALGGDELRAVKEVIGFDPDKTFVVDEEVLAHTRTAVERGQAQHAEWQKSFDAWAEANPERKALLDRLLAGELPDGIEEALPVFPTDKAL